MISTRKAALQGLAVRLTAIMVAVLGLWPEDDEEIPEPPPPPTNSGGGGGRIQPQRQGDARRLRRLQDQQRIQRNNMIAIATVLAMAEEGLLT